MTNINCSSKCIYQKEGKCNLDSVYSKNITSNNNCAYYSDVIEKIDKKNKE